ncbi:MAG: hypothetical protein O7F73_01380 [Gammaproteobacteria bacterium]|nr:hypothetical protein [Gammaproteobacteria bacterium]
MQRLLPTAALALLLASCASVPRVATNENPDANFSSFSTYNFMQPLATDRPSGVQTPLKTYWPGKGLPSSVLAEARAGLARNKPTM